MKCAFSFCSVKSYKRMEKTDFNSMLKALNFNLSRWEMWFIDIVSIWSMAFLRKSVGLAHTQNAALRTKWMFHQATNQPTVQHTPFWAAFELAMNRDSSAKFAITKANKKESRANEWRERSIYIVQWKQRVRLKSIQRNESNIIPRKQQHDYRNVGLMGFRIYCIWFHWNVILYILGSNRRSGRTHINSQNIQRCVFECDRHFFGAFIDKLTMPKTVTLALLGAATHTSHVTNILITRWVCLLSFQLTNKP